MKTLKKLLNSLIIFIFFLISFASIGFCQNQYWSTLEKHYFLAEKIPGFIPKAKNLRPLLLGFDNFTADLFWLKTVQLIGAHVQDTSFDGFYYLLDLTTDLDPNFEEAYRVGGILLPVFGNTKEARLLLEKGHTNMPKNWQMLWHLAFVNYFYFEDYEAAINNYDDCAKLPNCLKTAQTIALGLKSKTGKYELAYQEWKSIYENQNSSQDEKAVALKKMEEAEELFNLNELAKAFEEKHQRPINDLAELKKEFQNYLSEDKFTSPFTNNPYHWNAEKKQVRTKLW